MSRTSKIPMRQVSALAVAIAMACAAGSASAADWTYDPRIVLNATANDNNRMSNVPGEEIDVAGAEIDASIAFRAETPRSSFRLVPRVRAYLYPSEDDEDTDSEYLNFDYEFRGQRSAVVLDGGFSRQETLGRYFPDGIIDDPDLGEPDPGDDLGNTDDRNVQERLLFTPDVSFDITERSAIELGFGFLDVTFAEQVESDREDYNNLSADVGFRFDLSPTKYLRLRAGAGQYDPEDDVATDSQSLELEWGNRVSETSRMFVRAGSSRTEEVDALGDSSWNTGFSGGAGVQWAFEVTRLFLDYTHGLDPNSSGRLVERSQLRLGVDRRLSEVTTLRFGVRGVLDSQATSQDVLLDREYAQAFASFEWRFTRQFALGGGYQYTWRSVEDQPDDAESNRIYLGVTWQPRRL